MGGIWNRHVLKASRMNPITWMNLVAYQNKKICICIVLHCPFAFINKTVGCHHSSKFHFKETKKISNPFIVRNKLNTLIRLSFLILCRSHIFIFLLSFFFKFWVFLHCRFTYCWNYAFRWYSSSIVVQGEWEIGKWIIHLKL